MPVTDDLYLYCWEKDYTLESVNTLASRLKIAVIRIDPVSFPIYQISFKETIIPNTVNCCLFRAENGNIAVKMYRSNESVVINLSHYATQPYEKMLLDHINWECSQQPLPADLEKPFLQWVLHCKKKEYGSNPQNLFEQYEKALLQCDHVFVVGNRCIYYIDKQYPDFVKKCFYAYNRKERVAFIQYVNSAFCPQSNRVLSGSDMTQEITPLQGKSLLDFLLLMPELFKKKKGNDNFKRHIPVVFKEHLMGRVFVETAELGLYYSVMDSRKTVNGSFCKLLLEKYNVNAKDCREALKKESLCFPIVFFRGKQGGIYFVLNAPHRLRIENLTTRLDDLRRRGKDIGTPAALNDWPSIESEPYIIRKFDEELISFMQAVFELEPRKTSIKPDAYALQTEADTDCVQSKRSLQISRNDKGYSITAIDGGCGYTAFGITRQEAAQQLIQNIQSVQDRVKIVMQQALVANRQFRDHLRKNQHIANDATDEAILNDGARYAENLNILSEYIKFDVMENAIDAGAHPLILHAIAQIKSIELKLWVLGENGVLVPYRHRRRDTSEEAAGEEDRYHSTNLQSPQSRLDLLLRNGNYFERLTLNGYAGAIPSEKIFGYRTVWNVKFCHDDDFDEQFMLDDKEMFFLLLRKCQKKICHYAVKIGFAFHPESTQEKVIYVAISEGRCRITICHDASLSEEFYLQGTLPFLGQLGPKLQEFLDEVSQYDDEESNQYHASFSISRSSSSTSTLLAGEYESGQELIKQNKMRRDRLKQICKSREFRVELFALIDNYYDAIQQEETQENTPSFPCFFLKKQEIADQVGRIRLLVYADSAQQEEPPIYAITVSRKKFAERILDFSIPSPILNTTFIPVAFLPKFRSFSRLCCTDSKAVWLKENTFDIVNLLLARKQILAKSFSSYASLLSNSGSRSEENYSWKAKQETGHLAISIKSRDNNRGSLYFSLYGDKSAGTLRLGNVFFKEKDYDRKSNGRYTRVPIRNLRLDPDKLRDALKNLITRAKQGKLRYNFFAEFFLVQYFCKSFLHVEVANCTSSIIDTCYKIGLKNTLPFHERFGGLRNVIFLSSLSSVYMVTFFSNLVMLDVVYDLAESCCIFDENASDLLIVRLVALPLLNALLVTCSEIGLNAVENSGSLVLNILLTTGFSLAFSGESISVFEEYKDDTGYYDYDNTTDTDIKFQKVCNNGAFNENHPAASGDFWYVGNYFCYTFPYDGALFLGGMLLTQVILFLYKIWCFYQSVPARSARESSNFQYGSAIVRIEDIRRLEENAIFNLKQRSAIYEKHYWLNWLKVFTCVAAFQEYTWFPYSKAYDYVTISSSAVVCLLLYVFRIGYLNEIINKDERSFSQRQLDYLKNHDLDFVRTFFTDLATIFPAVMLVTLSIDNYFFSDDDKKNILDSMWFLFLMPPANVIINGFFRLDSCKQLAKTLECHIQWDNYIADNQQTAYVRPASRQKDLAIYLAFAIIGAAISIFPELKCDYWYINEKILPPIVFFMYAGFFGIFAERCYRGLVNGSRFCGLLCRNLKFRGDHQAQQPDDDHSALVVSV